MRLEITQAQLDEAVQLLEFDYSQELESVRTDYSGRGMFGANCLGVVDARLGTVMVFMITLATAVNHEGEQEEIMATMADLANNLRTDSMGLSTIYYWPGVTVTE